MKINESQKKFLAKVDSVFILLFAVILISLFLFDKNITAVITIIAFIISIGLTIYSRTKFKKLKK